MFAPSSVPSPSATTSASTPSNGAFAANARRAQAAGLTVLPTAPDNAKRPLVRSWSRFARQPRLSTVDGWIDRFPGANIAYLPAASGLVVVDIDDRKHEDRARRLLNVADTPVVIATGRGLHLPLRAPPIPGFDLRRHGIAGEIKSLRSIVVAPGSVHPDTGQLYRFLSGSWEDFAAVPALDPATLELLLPAQVQPDCVPTRDRNKEGTRNTATFDHLRMLGAQGILQTREDVRAAALEYNRVQNDPPEPERNVIATADSVWRMVEAGRCMPPRSRALVGIGERERVALRSLDTSTYSYADAMTLLLELKANHGARALRGASFASAAAAMAAAKVIPGWSDRKRYMRATRALQSVGLIERVSSVVLQKYVAADGTSKTTARRAAQYRFGSRP